MSTEYALDPIAADAEFDPRTAGSAVGDESTNTPAPDPGRTGAASTAADDWAAMRADLDPPAPAEPSPRASWPTVGTFLQTAPTNDSPPPAPAQPAAPALTPISIMSPDAGVPAPPVASPESSTQTPTPATAPAEPRRPAPRPHHASTGARRTSRKRGSGSGGGGGGGMTEALRGNWGVVAGVAFLVVFGLVWVTSSGGDAEPEATNAQGSSSTVNVMSAFAFQGAAVPVSSSAGPQVINDISASGFAQSELGAAMAALHLAVRTDPATSPAVFGPAITEQTTGDSAAFLATRTSQYEALSQAAGVPSGQPVTAPTGSMIGWKIAGWAPDQQNTVHLLVQIPNSGKYVDIAVNVMWDTAADDYTLVATSSGDWPSVNAVPTDGYTKFL